MEQDKRAAATLRLLGIMDELRAKCPWDRKQTFETLRDNTIEETYELADAITDHCKGFTASFSVSMSRVSLLYV